MVQALRERLAGRASIPIAVGLGLVLALPALGGGLATEDHVHADAIRRGVVSWPWNVNLFAYSDGDVRTIYALKDLGTIPWIAHEAYEVSFWRPLASWTHFFDHAYLAASPWAMHAHSLAWFAAVVVAAGMVLRRLATPAWAAGIALVAFAVDDAHGHAIGWLANRNALLATFFAVLSLHEHDRWRRDGRRAGAVLAPILLALGLLSGELAAGILGYFVAHAAFVDRGALRARLLALLPCFGVVLTWAVTYRALGHGTEGSGLYIDPLREPRAFLGEALWRAPALGTGLLGWPPSDAWNAFDAGAKRWAAAGFVGAVTVVAAVTAPLVRGDARLRFWIAGAVLSALPALATFPSDRLLFLPGLGVAAFIGAVVAAALDGRMASPVRRAAVAVTAMGLVGANVVLGGVALPSRVRTMENVARGVERAVASAMTGHAAADQLLVLVNAPSFYVGALVVGVPSSRGEPVPRHTRVLFGGSVPVAVARLDDRTLLVRAQEGFFTDPIDRVYRGRRHALRPGDGLMLTSTLAIVQEVTAEGDPSAVTYRFAAPLEDPSQRFLEWSDGAYRPFSPPAVGETRMLAPAWLAP